MARVKRLAKVVDDFEENLIAFFMGMMTLVTFANVIARYVFNANILWALEVTVFMFAWLVLLGASYCAKKTLHLGVDVIVQRLPPGLRRLCALIALAACLLFSILLLIGSWNYWYPFISKLSFYETEDVPVPFFLNFLGDVFNHGEAYEKLPKFIPYFVLPFSMALLTYRFVEIGVKIYVGKMDMVIANHETEVEEAILMMDGPHDLDIPGVGKKKKSRRKTSSRKKKTKKSRRSK